MPIIESEQYRKNRNNARRLKRHAEKFDAELAKQKSQWEMRPTPILVSLHDDTAMLPASVLLQLDPSLEPQELSRYAIYKRMARVCGSFDAAPDAVIEGADFDSLA